MKNVSYYIVITFLRAVALLPLRVLYAFSDIVYLIVYYVVKYRRKHVTTNLTNAFPEKTPEELKRIERAFYHHLCDCMVETVKMLHISDKEMRKRVDVQGASLIEQAADDHRPAFLFIGHMGNWEWVQEVTKRIRRPQVHGELYRPLRNKVFDRVMSTIRSRYPTLQITKKQAVRAIIRMRQEHESFLIGFIGDQRPPRGSLHHWMTFLHQDTPYMVGGEEIGRHVQAKFLFLDVRKPQRGHYVMTVKDMVLPADAPKPGKGQYPYIELYFKMFEQNICEAPELWLWSHNRWKYKK